MKNQTIITATQLLTAIDKFKTRKAKKSWLSKKVKEQELRLNDIIEKKTLKGWKHYYGQPIHDQFIRFQEQQLIELMEARQRLEPKAQRVDLPTIKTKQVNDDIIEVAESKPKTKAKSKTQPKKTQPKSDDAMATLVNSIANLTNQMASLVEMVNKNTEAIANLQQPKVEQPIKKAKKQPQVDKKSTIKHRTPQEIKAIREKEKENSQSYARAKWASKPQRKPQQLQKQLFTDSELNSLGAISKALATELIKKNKVEVVSPSVSVNEINKALRVK